MAGLNRAINAGSTFCGAQVTRARRASGSLPASLLPWGSTARSAQETSFCGAATAFVVAHGCGGVDDEVSPTSAGSAPPTGRQPLVEYSDLSAGSARARGKMTALSEARVNVVGNRGPLCVAVINLKGGVGKTTIAALLGRHAFRRLGLGVLAVDMDPQANLSQAYMSATYQQFIRSSSPSIVEMFSGMHPPGPEKASSTRLQIEDAIVRISQSQQGGGHLDLIPSRFDFSHHLTESLKPDATVLARRIAEHFQQKDLILVDCAPTESVFTTAAYHASRFILVPVKPEFFATIGFPLLRQSLEGFRQKNQGHKIDVVGVVVNNGFYDGGNNGGPEKQRALKEITEEAKKNGWKLFRNEIPYSRGFPKLMRGDYQYSGNAELFPAFASEFFQRLGLQAAKS